MSHSEQVSAFIANILLHDPEPTFVTPLDMVYNIGSWAEDGVEMPEGMNALEAAEEYNRMLLRPTYC